MKLQPHGDSVGPRETLTLECGHGEQILRWVGYAACARLAALRSTFRHRLAFLNGRLGEPTGRYIPQAVCGADGKPMDADIILNAVFGDGDVVGVGYDCGPVAFTARYVCRCHLD